MTSNTFLRQLCLICSQLQAWRDSKDLFLKIMAENTKKKYDKYNGNYESANPYLFLFMLLDPRQKERFLRYCFVVLFGEFKTNELAVKVWNNLSSLYDEYRLLYCDDVEVMEVVNDKKELEVDNEVDARLMFDSGYINILKDNISIKCKREVDL